MAKSYGNHSDGVFYCLIWGCWDFPTLIDIFRITTHDILLSSFCVSLLLSLLGSSVFTSQLFDLVAICIRWAIWTFHSLSIRFSGKAVVSFSLFFLSYTPFCGWKVAWVIYAEFFADYP